MLKIGVTRRRAINLIACAAGAGLTGCDRTTSRYEWQGTALGADARLLFLGVDRTAAQRALDACRLEIERLEALFSLNRPDSELSRLNAERELPLPSLDLERLLGLSRMLHRLTGGRFDPTVQGLWRHYAEWYAGRPDREAPPASTTAARLAEIGICHIDEAGGKLRLTGKAQITLNGIAQGYITDRVADLLRRFGFANVLIDIGEVRAIGERQPGRAFEIAIKDTPLRLPLADRALATSSPAGLVFSEKDGLGHIIDPVTGRSRSAWRSVTASHPSAAVADGLSTALVLADRAAIRSIIASIPAARIWVTRDGGAVETFESDLANTTST